MPPLWLPDRLELATRLWDGLSHADLRQYVDDKLALLPDACLSPDCDRYDDPHAARAADTPYGSRTATTASSTRW